MSAIQKMCMTPFSFAKVKIFATANRDITFAFDQDTKPTTIAAVRTATTKTARILQHQGCKISVLNWNAPAKGVDDLILLVGADGLERFFSDRLPFDQWQLASTFSLVEYPANNVNVRYLTQAEINIANPEGKIIAIKSSRIEEYLLHA